MTGDPGSSPLLRVWLSGEPDDRVLGSQHIRPLSEGAIAESKTYLASEDDAPVVLPAQSPDGLDGHAEKEDTDDTTGEHGLRADMPGRGQEAGVDGVPVPKH